MRRYRYIQLDVFTHVMFGGNQLAVFPHATGLNEREMQALAREINFSETTFVLPGSDPRAIRRVRIFTPAAELPMAGHPVVGTTFALAHEGIIRAGEVSPVYLQLGVGTLPVDVLFEEHQLSFVWMHQPVPVFRRWEGDRNLLAATVGLAADDLALDLPVELASAGVPFLFVPLRTRAAVSHARPGNDLTRILGHSEEHAGIYLFALEGVAGSRLNAYARMFAPDLGVTEDAATGSAAGPLGAYLVAQHQLECDERGEARVHVVQGVEMGRPSRIEVAVSCPSGDIEDVRVGGEAVVVSEGEFQLPDQPESGAE